jgi:hypothetical protein
MKWQRGEIANLSIIERVDEFIQTEAKGHYLALLIRSEMESSTYK